MSMDTFERLESQVRSYCRDFPTVFTAARGSTLEDEAGRSYLDFFAGAGALNYGHNNPALKAALLEYVASDGVTHSLDMATAAKRRFIDAFQSAILTPRGMDYRFLFPGPTGTNAVEVALKIARKVTGRTQVVSFTNGFHGMTLGSLAVTGNQGKREGAGIPLEGAQVMPFDGYMGADVDTLELIGRYLDDRSSGIEPPAAFLVETVQAEGGVLPASWEWLRGLQALARRVDALLIIDDIQVGCGRTGPFFSFEPAGLEPDIICLSKSLSGYGLPLSLVLVNPSRDVLRPGEHNGTFRGHNPAFVTATAALDFWRDEALTVSVCSKASYLSSRMEPLARRAGATLRGRGLIWGLEFPDSGTAGAISRAAFKRGLIVETAGPEGEVLKLLPPLTITLEELSRGLSIIEECAGALLDLAPPPARAPTPEGLQGVGL